MLYLKQALIRHANAFGGHFGKATTTPLGETIITILMVAETLVCIFWIYVLSSLGEGYAFMAAIPYAYFVVSYTSLLIFYHLKRIDYFVFVQLVMLLVMPFFMQWVIGGFEASSGVAIWALLSPVGALMILGTRQSTGWFLLFLGLAGLSWHLNSQFASNALPIPVHIKDTFFLMNISGTASILYGVMHYFQSQKERVMHALEEEQARSEKLLLNIMPQTIADRLKADDLRIADSHDSVTIMFADLVEFTQTAKDYITNLMAQENSAADSFVRVGVKGGGCSGLEYKLSFDNEIKAGDEVYEDKGIKIVVDMKSLLYLYGTELDYSGGLNGKGLTFKNPNATRTCSCGESFSV